MEDSKKIIGSGRKKGSKNRPKIPPSIKQSLEAIVAKDVRVQLKDILTNELSSLPADLAAMTAARKWETIANLLKYCLPTLSAQKIEADVNSEMKISVEFVKGD